MRAPSGLGAVELSSIVAISGVLGGEVQRSREEVNKGVQMTCSASGLAIAGKGL